MWHGKIFRFYKSINMHKVIQSRIRGGEIDEDWDRCRRHIYRFFTYLR
jgi:hypothetical protein